MKDRLNKQDIMDLLPHREPMLLINELKNIKKLFSATAIVNVEKDSFFVQGHFPGQPVMPGVLIVEAFGQAAAALTAHGLDKSTYENKLVFLMNIEKGAYKIDIGHSGSRSAAGNLNFGTAIKSTPGARGGQAPVEFVIDLLKRKGKNITFKNKHGDYPITERDYLKQTSTFECLLVPFWFHLASMLAAFRAPFPLRFWDLCSMRFFYFGAICDHPQPSILALSLTRRAIA